ncbi:MAG: hypothetical protein ABL953_09955 [Ilumatobacteraceae bacterium]
MAVTRGPMCALAILAMLALTGPGSPQSAAAEEPVDEWVKTSPDSVMDAETFEELEALADEQPAEQSTGDGFFASVTLGDGFNTFVTVAGALRHYGDYNIRLITSGEGNIEIYRDELQQVANEVNAHNGLSIQVAASTFAPPADWNNFSIPAGQIWVVIKLDSPCGSLSGGKLGCGGVRGSTVIEGVNRWAGGIVWLSPTLSAACDQPVIGHEIGHALGLNHFDSNYAGVAQLMKSSTNCSNPVAFQAGDLNGVRWGAEPTPGNDSKAASTAAAVCPGDSTVSASTWFATKESGELAHAGHGPRRSVWFRYDPRPEQDNADATIRTTPDGTDDFDTVLAVYQGATGPSTAVTSDDNSGTGAHSEVTFQINDSYTYWIAVDGNGFARGETDVVFDLPPLNDDLIPLCAPARLLDTRAGQLTVDGAHQGVGKISANTTYQLPVAGRAGIPTDADTVVLNVTAVLPGANGFITVFPCGEARPLTSNLNFAVGDVFPNAVLARVGSAQSVCIYSTATTDVLVDVSAYFPTSDALVPLTAPARLLETREGDGPGGPATIDHQHEGVGLIEAGETYALDVYGRDLDGAGSSGGVLDNAATVVLNVTAILPLAQGYLTVFPCDEDRPLASNLNFVAGDVVPNSVLARVSAAGTVCFFALRTTDLVVDVSGYFPNTDSLTSLLVPERMLETRAGLSTVDGQHQSVGRLAAGTTYQLPIAGRGGVPASAVSVVLNVTAIGPAAQGFLTVFACGQDRPNASNLNFKAGDVIPNFVLARIGTGGKVCLYTKEELDVVVDVSGYFL